MQRAAAAARAPTRWSAWPPLPQKLASMRPMPRRLLPRCLQAMVQRAGGLTPLRAGQPEAHLARQVAMWMGRLNRPWQSRHCRRRQQQRRIVERPKQVLLTLAMRLAGSA